MPFSYIRGESGEVYKDQGEENEYDDEYGQEEEGMMPDDTQAMVPAPEPCTQYGQQPSHQMIRDSSAMSIMSSAWEENSALWAYNEQ